MTRATVPPGLDDDPALWTGAPMRPVTDPDYGPPCTCPGPCDYCDPIEAQEILNRDAGRSSS